MSFETIELLSDGPVATIRLNRPERMNAVITEGGYPDERVPESEI